MEPTVDVCTTDTNISEELKSLSVSSLLSDNATLDSHQNLLFKQPQVLISITTCCGGQLVVYKKKEKHNDRCNIVKIT